MRLANRRAVVTGAQQGIGAAVARVLASEGATLIVNYLDDEPAARGVVDEIEGAGGRAIAVQADVSVEHDVARLVAAAGDLGGVDILVNNAGVFPRAPFLEMTTEEWDTVLGVNLRGAFLCTQAAARDMESRSAGGAIVNVSSAVAFLGSSRGVHYSASKAGLLGMTRASALALAPLGIRVNAVAAGMVDTDQPRAGLSEEAITEIVSGFPLGRLIAPDEIAESVAFLVSDAARSITGHTLHVNGGALMT